MEEIVISKLEELIAITRAAAISADMRWVGSDTIAAILDITSKHFLSEIACQADFPTAFRGADGKKHPRWNLTEVTKWIERKRMGLDRRGRPRQ